MSHNRNFGVLREIAVLVLSVTIPLADLRAQYVESHDGNIIYFDSQGKSKEITSKGSDFDPSLSYDGMRIAFLRQTFIPARVEEPSDPKPFMRQIWISNVEGIIQPQLVFSGPLVLPDHSEYVSFAAPRLSPDKDNVYFWFPASVVDGGVARFDLKTRRASFVCYGLSFDIVPSGQYARDLIVETKNLRPGGGYITAFRLYTPAGKDLGEIGETEQDVKAFLASPTRTVKP